MPAFENWQIGMVTVADCIPGRTKSEHDEAPGILKGSTPSASMYGAEGKLSLL